MSDHAVTGTTPDQPPQTAADPAAAAAAEALVAEDLLVEEVSIDGMCGVY